ncbi:MAG: L,D-transpeptidase family protein [Pseudomonadota bacterium]
MMARSAARSFFAALLLLAIALPAPGARATGAEPDDLIGQAAVYTARHEDSLPQLARELGVGFVALMAANPGIDPWLPGEGREMLVPRAHLLPEGARRGIVINLAELRLYHFRRDGSVATYPVGIGRDYWETPRLNTKITRKRRNPTWVPPASIRAEKPDLPASVGPGPDNPLGDFALNLGYDAYVIHGTNKPLGVGRRVSHGCIRLYPEDIAALFEEVGTGVPVQIVDQEIKLGWSGGALWIEAHPGQSYADAVEAGEQPDYYVDLPGLMIRLAEMPGAAELELDWDLIERVLRERRGVPVQISTTGLSARG